MTVVASFTPTVRSLRLDRARAALGRGDAATARRLVRPLADAEPDPEALALYAEASLLDGGAEELGDRLRAAAAGVSEELRARLLRLAAEALLREERTAEAAQAALAAVDAAPRDADAAETFGWCLLRIGKLDEAALVFADIVRGAPGPRRRSWLGLTMALRRQGALEAAEETARAAQGLFPNDLRFDIELAEIALAQGRPAEAKRLLLALPPSRRLTVEALTTLAKVHLVMDEEEEAKACFVKAHRLAPDDPTLRHLAGEAPLRASDDYVRSLFDGYAARFEANLIHLGYRVPGLVLRALEQWVPGLAEGSGLAGPVLDLGCGTGLIGVVLHDLLRGPLVGVDLSPRMLAEARKKEVYAELHEAEIGAFLSADERRWRTIVAADVFCYFGDLTAMFRAVRERIAPDGLFVFSVERAEGAPWLKTATGRYAHDEDHVRGALAGWQVLSLERTTLRMDRGRPVEGLLAVARG